MADSRRDVSGVSAADSKQAAPNIETGSPVRPGERGESRDPRCRRSETEAENSERVQLKRDSARPGRAHERRGGVLPSSVTSGIRGTEPGVMAPKRRKAEPRYAEDCDGTADSSSVQSETESVGPGDAALKTGTPGPKRPRLCRDMIDSERRKSGASAESPNRALLNARRAESRHDVPFRDSVKPRNAESGVGGNRPSQAQDLANRGESNSMWSEARSNASSRVAAEIDGAASGHVWPLIGVSNPRRKRSSGSIARPDLAKLRTKTGGPVVTWSGTEARSPNLAQPDKDKAKPARAALRAGKVESNSETSEAGKISSTLDLLNGDVTKPRRVCPRADGLDSGRTRSRTNVAEPSCTKLCANIENPSVVKSDASNAKPKQLIPVVSTAKPKHPVLRSSGDTSSCAESRMSGDRVGAHCVRSWNSRATASIASQGRRGIGPSRLQDRWGDSQACKATDGHQRACLNAVRHR